MTREDTAESMPLQKGLVSRWRSASREDRIGLLRQFVKFGIVGVSNTLISLGIYYLLVFLHVHYIIANTTAFVISVLNAYYWNNRFVFSKTTRGHLKPLIRTYIAYGATFLLGTLLLFLQVQILGISKFIAPLVNLAVTIPLNFLVNRFWAFR